MDDTKKSTSVNTPVMNLGRRDLIKLGVGATVAATIQPTSLAAKEPMPAQGAVAQLEKQVAPAVGNLEQGPHRSVQQWPDIVESRLVVTSTQPGYTVYTGPGWTNNSGRSFGNGPMDEVSRRIVEFVSGYSETNLTDSLSNTIGNVMIDTLAVLYGGFESEPARIAARLAQTMRGDMKCTVLGYGVTTTPEMAAFANAAMIRHLDFNTVPHNTEFMGGILAIGEALHSTGPQIMAALTIAYEVETVLRIAGASGGSPNHVEWDSPQQCIAVAAAVGKLMGLNQDQLANAISLAIIPHMPMYSHVGVQSMWKGTHSSEAVRCGVWAAMLAREGMTGPHMPFEGRDGLLAQVGPFTRDIRFPSGANAKTALENIHGKGGGYKRVPSEGSTQTFNQLIAPAVYAWTKPEEIASIDVRLYYSEWQEICDPPKWDPRNRETADHSLPYNIARHIIDKDIYFGSFAKEKYMDPVARELMNKIVVHPSVDPEFGHSTMLTVRKKSGEDRVFKAAVEEIKPMTRDDLIEKYNRAAEFIRVDKAQADRVLKQWTNLRDVKDISDAIQTIAKFGQPRPLSDRAPARIS